MIVPLCSLCGHQMYFGGTYMHPNGTIKMNRWMCINCPHTEDMICVEKDDTEIIS